MPRSRLMLIAIVAGLVGSTAASATQTITYSYDARGRLIKVVRDDNVDNSKDAQVCYKLDRADNRTRVKADVGPTTLPACPTP